MSDKSISPSREPIAAGVIAAAAAAALALLIGASADLTLLAGSTIAGAGVVAGLWLIDWAARFTKERG